MAHDENEDEMLTVPELATRLRVCEETVRRLAANGELPGVRIGSQWRFPRKSVAKLMAGAAADMQDAPTPTMATGRRR